MGNPPLPDVPEEDYRLYAANQFGLQNQARIHQFQFAANNQARIASLQGLGMPGFETPEIASSAVIQQNPQIQLPPIPTPQLPAMPQLPLGTPAPAPMPAPTPLPAPPQQPIIGATPAPMTIAPPEQPVTQPTQPGQPRILGGASTPPSAAELAPPAPPGGPPDINGPARPVWDTSTPSTTTTTATAPKQTITQPIDSTSRSAFAASMTPYAVQAAQQLGIDPAWIVAMAGSESNFGKAAGNELFGVKALPGQPGTTMMTHEGEYGGTAQNATFASYDSPQAAVDAWVNLIKNHYPGAVGAKDLPTFIHGLKAGGYFTAAEPEYLGIVSSIDSQLRPTVEATKAATPSTTSQTPSQTVTQPSSGPSQTAMNQSQFGDKELTAAEAQAACGPAAAVRFAQAYGRNPTLREATDLAAQVGWTPGSGMAGIGSEQKLLDKMGIPTKLVGTDTAAMAAEAQTGNPVTISTANHYFYADGYNPTTGQFHVGRSGLDLIGGSEWMTPAQMEASQGKIQGALFADHPTVQSSSSTQTSPTAPLDAVKQKAQSIFSDFAQQPAQATQRLPGSNDPQVSQLNRAVEIAHMPSPPSGVTDITSAGSGNPFADLGNTIGNAITNALSSAFGGGGPPRRDTWQQQQDDQSADQGTDVGSRSRAMIERLQTLPGGQKLGDVVGAPDLLPPDWDKLKNASPADALQEMMDRGNQLANISRPSIGPGGLGIVDPRLGNDPRMDVPDAIEPIGRLLGAIGDVGGGALERIAGRIESNPERAGNVGRMLDDAFEREAMASGRGLTGGITQDALDNLRTAGDILESNTDMPMLDIARQGRDSLAGSLSRTRGQQAWDTMVRNLTDSGTDLNNIEKEMASRKGAPLTDSERVGLLARVDPTHQASQEFEQNVGSALRDVSSAGGQQALKDFYDLVEHRTNQSVAEGLAKQTERDYLAGGIPDNVTSRLNEANAELDRAQTAHAQALADQRAVDAGSGYRTRQSISLDSAGQRVQSAEADLEEARQNAVDAAAAARHDATMRGSQGELVRRPEQRDLIIAEKDAQRAQARFERMAARDSSVPIAPQGQNNSVRQRYERQVQAAARQAGYAQDRASRLRAALGENTATREANVTSRAADAAQASRDAGRMTQTPELAAAKVRLQYEQKNLDRLQSAKAKGQQGLTDDLARAYKKVQKAQRDVDQATADLPEAAKAQGWAQLTGRTFSGPGGTPIHYDDVMAAQQAIRDKYADKPKVLDAFQNGLKAIQDHREQQLQEMVDHGIISADDKAKLLDQYDFWTPTRIMDYMSDDRAGIGMGGGNRFNVNSPGMMSYTPEGTSAEHENHVAALYRDTFEHKNRVAKNDVNAALIRGFGADRGVMNKVAGTVKEYEDSGRTLLPPDYSKKANEEKITALIDGKRLDYITDNPLLREATRVVNGNGDPYALTNIAQVPARMVRELAVQRNPAFLPMNLARDTIAYAIRNMSEAGIGGNLASAATNLGPAAATYAMTDPNDPNRGQKIAAATALGMGGRMAIGKNLGLGPSAMREYMAGILDSMSGLGSGRMTGEGVQQLERLGGGMRGGGFFSGAVGRGPAAAEKALEEITRGNAMTIRNGGDLKQVLGDLAGFGWSKAIGNRLEQAPRVATMRMALQRGSSPLEAMIKARDVTTDFNRGGRLSRELNRYVPFFNVGMQAPAQLGRLLHDHPGGATMAGLSLLAAPAAATEAWNYSDPQRARDYEDTPDYLKRLGVVIMAPGDAPLDAQGNRVPQKFFLPVPNEFMPFVEAGREGYKRMSGQGTPQSAGDIAKSLGTELSPIGSAGSVEQAVGGMVPMPFSTAMELQQNRDWFRGSTIANKYSDENASNLAKALAPALTDMLTQLPGQQMSEIHPSQIDFAIKDILNGPGQQLLNATDQASGRAPRVPGAGSETPVIGSIVSRFERGTGGQLLENARNETLTPSAARALRQAGVDWKPAPAATDIAKVPLLQAEQAQLQQLTNRYLDDGLQRLFRNSRWDSYSVTNRQKLVDMASSAARQKAQAEVMHTIPLAERHQRLQAAAQKARA